MSQENNPISRWSRRKLEHKKLEQEKAQAEGQAKQPPAAGDPAGKAIEDLPPPLPPVEGLTPRSDFTGFMHPKVADSLRRTALKKLFADPHFSIPDLNEAYSGDWTVGEPITPEMLKQLNQAYTLLFSDEEKKAFDEERDRLAAAEAQAGSPEKPTQPMQEAKQDEPGRKDT